MTGGVGPNGVIAFAVVGVVTNHTSSSCRLVVASPRIRPPELDSGSSKLRVRDRLCTH
jgi:hypothetical protein